MKWEFYKYQGAGNDFVVADNRRGVFPKDDTDLVARICHRRYGVGADGLILLEEDASCDFAMVYYNSDGKQSTMCGNGGRCIAAFAGSLGIGTPQGVTFRAVDGVHRAFFEDGQVRLGMNDVLRIEELDPKAFGGSLPVRWACFLDTGSPHFVAFLDEGLQEVDIAKYGREVRYGTYFAPRGGTNVNLVERAENGCLRVRTYERGVEDETLACGTGAVASALAAHYKGVFMEGRQEPDKALATHKTHIKTPGGILRVDFCPEDGGKYTGVWLSGDAERVFTGWYKIPGNQ